MWTIRYPKNDDELRELIHDGACTSVSYTYGDREVERKSFAQNCKNCGAPREIGRAGLAWWYEACSHCKSVQP